MAYQPVPNVIQVELRQTLDNQQIENVFHMRPLSGTAASMLGTAAQVVALWWYDHLRAQQANTLAFREAYATDLTTQDGGVASNNTNSGSTGTVASGSMPNNVAYCVTLRTGARGRSGRGRSYVAGVPVSNMAGNNVTEAWRLATTAAYGFLISDCTAAGLELGIVSRWNNKVLRAEGLFRPITNAVTIDGVVDSQRRRLPGRGV